jgi:MFS family permease
MITNMNLKELERKAFRSTFQDGLWDIFIGFLFTQFAIAPILGELGWGDFWSSAVLFPIYMIVLAVVMLLKKYVVTPRLGMVQFNKKRKSKFKKLILMTNIILVIGVIAGVFFVDLSNLNIKWLFPATFSLILLVGFSATAYLLDITRFYIYGAINCLAIIVGELLFRFAGASHHGFPVAFGVTSSIMIIVGIVLLIKFIRKYPKPDEDLNLEGAGNGNS